MLPPPRTVNRAMNRFYHDTGVNRYPSPSMQRHSKRDARWLDRAARAAAAVDGKWKVGCIIVASNRVLAVACNAPKNDPRVCQDRLWCASEHAEAAALRLAGPKAAGATAYVARLGRDGRLRHAQPCIRCQRLLDAAGTRAVWTTDEAYVAQRALSGDVLTPTNM